MNHKLGTNYTLSLATDYNFANWHWLDEEHKNVAQDVVNARGFFIDLQAYPGSLETLAKLVDDGHEVLITTSYSWSSEHSANEKIAWYKRHAPFLPIKNMMLGHQKKRILCDIAIDDGPDKMKKLKARQPNAKAATVLWPYHIGKEHLWDFIAHDYTRPADAWKQLSHYIDSVAAEDVVPI